MNMIKNSPWGHVQDITNHADGIDFVGTASHGGFHLSRERSKEFRKKFPNAKLFLGGSTWFEEDCDWALVVEAFPEEFKEEVVKQAIESNNNWHKEIREEV
jgi:hypothetical protein